MDGLILSKSSGEVFRYRLGERIHWWSCYFHINLHHRSPQRGRQTDGWQCLLGRQSHGCRPKALSFPHYTLDAPNIM